MLLHQRYSASTAQDASAALRAVFGVGEVLAGADLAYEQRSLVDDGVSVTRLVSAGTDVRVREAASPDLIVLAVREGEVELRVADETAVLGKGDVSLIPMYGAAELHWQRVTLDVFSFPLSTLGRLLGAGDRVVELRIPRLRPRSPQLAALWHRLATTLAAHVLEDAELYERDLLRTQMIDALLAATIEAFELSDVTEGPTAPRTDVLERAEAFMHEHLADPISIPDVARAVGVSARGLQLLYQRELDVPPIGRLRQLRMAAAKDVLAAAPSRSTTVGAVAQRFGYSNVGRFIAHYRSEYGETPAQTLQRTAED
jgi:AraC-like DNA-binding protein